MILLKKMALGIFAFCFLPVVYLFYLYTHPGFNPDEFKHSIVRGMKIELSLNEVDQDHVRSILNQKFFYLGFGKQMTAYESEDHLYVIKFFNPRPPIKKKWFHSYKKLKYFCTLKWLSRAYFRREERLHKIFQRHALAFDQLKEETALVYVHLNSSTAITHTLEIVDQNGLSHFLDLEQVPFALQKKVELAGDYLRRLSSQNDLEGIRKAFDQLQHLFASRSHKKFTDRVQTLNNNYGFLEDRAVQIDFGRIWKDENLDADEETERILNRLKCSGHFFRL